MAKKKDEPSDEFWKDLREVLHKHNFSGEEIRIAPVAAAADATLQCPPGKTPQLVSFKTPSGATVTKIICI